MDLCRSLPLQRGQRDSVEALDLAPAAGHPRPADAFQITGGELGSRRECRLDLLLQARQDYGCQWPPRRLGDTVDQHPVIQIIQAGAQAPTIPEGAQGPDVVLGGAVFFGLGEVQVGNGNFADQVALLGDLVAQPGDGVCLRGAGQHALLDVELLGLEVHLLLEFPFLLLHVYFDEVAVGLRLAHPRCGRAPTSTDRDATPTVTVLAALRRRSRPAAAFRRYSVAPVRACRLNSYPLLPLADATSRSASRRSPNARTIDAMKKYVVSTTLDRVDWNAELVRGDLGEAVRKLKQQPGKAILTGGVQLPLALAELGLIDEYEFVMQPRIAGHGPTLLAGLSKYIELKPVDRIELSSGAVALRYEPRK